MEKWADYLVSNKKYSEHDGKRYISEVEVRDDNGDSVGSPSWWSRNDVIKKIKVGYSFCSIYKGSNDKWKKGMLVEIVKIGNTEYIKTEKNNKEEDNLELIPQ